MYQWSKEQAIHEYSRFASLLRDIAGSLLKDSPSAELAAKDMLQRASEIDAEAYKLRELPDSVVIEREEAPRPRDESPDAALLN